MSCVVQGELNPVSERRSFRSHSRRRDADLRAAGPRISLRSVGGVGLKSGSPDHEINVRPELPNRLSFDPWMTRRLIVPSGYGLDWVALVALEAVGANFGPVVVHLLHRPAAVLEASFQVARVGVGRGRRGRQSAGRTAGDLPSDVGHDLRDRAAQARPECRVASKLQRRVKDYHRDIHVRIRRVAGVLILQHTPRGHRRAERRRCHDGSRATGRAVGRRQNQILDDEGLRAGARRRVARIKINDCPRRSPGPETPARSLSKTITVRPPRPRKVAHGHGTF